MARSEDEVPYKQSRAALRKIYGTRSIDASAPQSAQDGTPSGRIKYLEQNMPGAFASDEARTRAAKLAAEQDFRNNFKPRPEGFAPWMDDSPWRGVTATGPATPIPPAASWSMTYAPPPDNSIPQSMGLPGSPPASTPLSFPLNEPSPLTADALSRLAPATSAPMAYIPSWKKQPNPGSMGSVLAPANKWLNNSGPTYASGAPVPRFHQDFNRFMDTAAPRVMQAINPINQIFSGAQKAAGKLSDAVDTSGTGGAAIKRWLNYLSGRKT